MLRPVENLVHRAGLLLLAPCITSTRSHSPATTPRSWVIRMMAVPKSPLQLAHQLQDLRLHGDVQRRGGLVGDQQVRPAQQRRGDHHALAHAAGELVGIACRSALARFRDVHRVEHLDCSARAPPCDRCPRARCSTCAICVPHRQVRVQRGHRVLEDHADAAAAHAAQLRPAACRQARRRRSAREPLGAAVGRQQPDHGQHGLALAGARLAHDAQRLALVERRSSGRAPRAPRRRASRKRTFSLSTSSSAI